MATTPEGLVKKRVKSILEELGVWFFMPPANGYGRAGIPDFIGCLNGLLIAIETKSGKKEPTALQAREMRRIREVGGFAVKINEDNVDQLKDMILDRMQKDWIL